MQRSEAEDRTRRAAPSSLFRVRGVRRLWPSRRPQSFQSFLFIRVHHADLVPAFVFPLLWCSGLASCSGEEDDAWALSSGCLSRLQVVSKFSTPPQVLKFLRFQIRRFHKHWPPAAYTGPTPTRAARGYSNGACRTSWPVHPSGPTGQNRIRAANLFIQPHPRASCYPRLSAKDTERFKSKPWLAGGIGSSRMAS